MEKLTMKDGEDEKRCLCSRSGNFDVLRVRMSALVPVVPIVPSVQTLESK
jgi:hypothetical protein